MKSRTKKTIIFAIFALIAVSTATATVSSVEIDPLATYYDQGTSITITGEVYGTSIDKVTLQKSTDYGGSTTEGTDSNLGYCSSGCKVEIPYTFEETGDHTFYLRAYSGDQQTEKKAENTQRVTVVQPDDRTKSFDLENVGASRFKLDRGQSTTLNARVENNGDVGSSVLVTWYAERNNNEIELASKYRYISDGDTKTFRPESLSWDDLNRKGLNQDRNYDLIGKMRVDNEVKETATASNTLRINSEDTEASLTVNVEDADGDSLSYSQVAVDGTVKNTGSDGTATFSLDSGSYEITASKNNYIDGTRGVYLTPGEDQTVTIQLDREREQARLTVHTGEINREGPTDVIVHVDGQSRSTGDDDRVTFRLDPDTYTVSASANEEYSAKDVTLSNGERETIHLGLPRDRDDRGDDDARLNIRTRDQDGNRLRNVEVSVGGRTANTGSSSSASFSLESGGYEVTASKSGYISASRGVYLSPGEEQTETLYLERRTSDRPECDLSVSRVDIEDNTIAEGESTDVRLTIDSGDVEQDFRVLIETEEATYYDKRITVDGRRTITKNIAPESPVKVFTRTEAVGSPCGYEEWTSSDEILVADIYGEEDRYDLTVDVEDEDGDNIENAEVRVTNGVDFEEDTGSNGRAYFSLENGDYELEVSKNGYEDVEKDFSINSADRRIDVTLIDEDDDDSDNDGEGEFTARVIDQDHDRLEDARVRVEGLDSSYRRTQWTDDDGETTFDLDEGDYEVTAYKPGYSSQTRDIEIDEGDDFTRGFQLFKDENLEISNVNYPDNVCRGASMSVSFTVRNTGNSREVVDISGSGLGSDPSGKSIVLDSGESRRASVMFTGVQGSGSERFTVDAYSNGETASATRTVNVQSCGVSNFGQARDISMTLNPDRTLSGQPVKVKGYVDGGTGRQEVEIKVDGDRAARVSTQPDGYYQTYIRVSEVGTHSVSAEADGISATRDLEVLPTVSATMINPPRQVFEGEEFELCAEISSQITPRVVLLRDGEVIQTRDGGGEVCFTPTASDPGEHEYMIRAVTYGQGTAATAKINVLETGPETTSFPENLAAVESESGLVKAEIYNTHNEIKRYHVSLEGLPNDWVSTSEKEVVLTQGERKTVYFYIMPKDEGNYGGDIVIESDGSEIYRENVTIWSGGTTEEADKNWLSRVKGFWPF